MKNKKLYPALKLIRSTEMRHPEIFEMYDEGVKNRLSNKQSEFDVATLISRHFFPKAYQEKDANICALLLSVLGEWRKSKQVYSFSKELINMISDTEEFEVCGEIFEYLPYPCFYIEIPDSKLFHGMFIKYLKDAVNDALLFILLCNDGAFAHYAFDLTKTSNFYETIEKYAACFQNASHREFLKKYMIFGFQASMYLCAKNSDVSENLTQQKIYKPSNRIKNNFSEIRKWDVGFRIIKDINASFHSHESMGTDGKIRNRPRQHWRKAHWHTYWVGKGRTKRELRFIAPILVNDIEDELPIVAHT